MTRNEIKEKIRKIKWATEKEIGKKLGKKGLLAVQSVVMAMNKIAEIPPEPRPTAENWREEKKGNIEKMSVDLNKLIGRNFAQEK